MMIDTQEKKQLRIAVVTSRFNEAITQRLFDGAMARLAVHGMQADQIRTFSVPGAVEIPLVAKQLAKGGAVDAIIALGAVIRGETSHYDLVCDQVSQGCAKVSYDYDLPVVFGVLTTEDSAQALARSGGEHSHMGESAVDTALEMIGLLDQLRE
jgi:6,7-dimethyl-8-ribityllumazine synthase